MKTYNRFQEDIQKRREEIAKELQRKRGMEIDNQQNANTMSKLNNMKKKIKDEVKGEIYSELGVEVK